ncbi:MAG: ABC transporter permease [Pseudomonadota bacterium]
MDINLTLLLAGVLAGAAPILLATLGETLTEKAGVINLSLDGTILLSAMTAFVIACRTGSLAAGFAAGAATGAAVAAVVAFFSITLGQSQVAVGFVLTLTTRDLAYFLGNAYARVPGPQTRPLPIPGLAELPFAGPVFFQHPVPVYVSMMMIAVLWWFIYRTDAGLKLQAVGENPAAAYARGIDPRWRQIGYTIVGGLLVGLAGAAFSLAVKPGWGRPQGAEGTGWIALALVIFGGWHPVRAAAGAYLFAFLQVMGIHLQGYFEGVPSQVFQVAPFPLMIFMLVLISMAQRPAFMATTTDRPALSRLLRVIAGNAPKALGKNFQP